MTEQREESIRKALEYCIENFGKKEAVNRIIDFIKDEEDINFKSTNIFKKGDTVIVCNKLRAKVLEVIRPNLLRLMYDNGNAISNEFTNFIKHA